MSTFAERLATFTSWPHTVPSPEALADAGFSHQPTSEQPDAVICQVCKTCLVDWEPEDDPKVEHYFGSKTSKSCMRFASKSDPTLIFVQHPVALPQKDAQASAQADLPVSPAPKPSPKDVGFLDPSLQHDFPELCLFHDANVFCDRIDRCRSDFSEADILAILPRCLRGEALKWFNQSECQDLAVCLLAMKARFPQASQQAPQQASSQAAPQEPPQVISQIACQALEYHHCKLCNASFSSMARLIRHTQEDVCNKPSCRHCDMVFSSKNRLHQHLREECQKQRQPRSSSRSSSRSSPRSSSRCSPASSPSPPPKENRVSLPPSPSPSPPPQYRTISPPPPTYGNYLTVADLYARYTPRYLKMDDLFRMFGRRSTTTTKFSATAAPITPAAPKHPPIRHRGRCQAKKGDGSTKPPKNLPKYLNTLNNKTNKKPKTKNPFPLLTRTPLQSVPYKTVLSVQRSRSTSCPIAAPYSPSSHMRAPPQSSPYAYATSAADTCILRQDYQRDPHRVARPQAIL